MNFQDDSHILSRLGILDSTEESPRRVKVSPVITKKKSPESETFVEVNISGDIETESEEEEDTIFDQDTLLSQRSKSKVLRRKPDTFRCRYILLMLSYFSLGALCHSSTGLLRHNPSGITHLMHVWQCIGTLCGVFIGRLAIFRLNSFVFFLVNFLIVTVIFSLVATTPLPIHLQLLTAIEGVVVGVLSYAGLALYFSLWRTHNRKLMFFFALFALGSATIVFFVARPVEPTIDPSVKVGSITKRETSEIQPFGSDPSSTEFKPKKPEVAQGQSVIKTKTEENKQMREKTKSDFTNSTTDSSIKSSPPNSLSSAELSSTAVTSTSTTQYTTTVTATTLSVTSELLSERSTRSKHRFQLSVPTMSKENVFLLCLLGSTVGLHLLALACCCTPCKLGADPKIVKLRDPSQPSLTRSCKIRLSNFYILCGFIENFLMMYLSTDRSQVPLLPWAMFVTRFFAIVPGPSAYSNSAVMVTAIVGLISTIFVYLHIGVDLNLILLCGACGLLPICVLLNIESRLYPRPAVLIDYFLIPHSVGHLLTAVLCWQLQDPSYMFVTTAAFGLLVIILILLMKSLAKAARLKEIMEYPGIVPGATFEDYLVLLQQDRLTDDENTERGRFSDIDEQDETEQL